MTIPDRVQRSRAKGAKQPESTRYCGRGTKYGNDYRMKKTKNSYAAMVERFYAVEQYKIQMEANLKRDPTFYDDLLQFKHLSCFCPKSLPCHCDPIIEHLKMRVMQIEQ